MAFEMDRRGFLSLFGSAAVSTLIPKQVEDLAHIVEEESFKAKPITKVGLFLDTPDRMLPLGYVNNLDLLSDRRVPSYDLDYPLVSPEWKYKPIYPKYIEADFTLWFEQDLAKVAYEGFGILRNTYDRQNVLCIMGRFRMTRGKLIKESNEPTYVVSVRNTLCKNLELQFLEHSCSADLTLITDSKEEVKAVVVDDKPTAIDPDIQDMLTKLEY
tara:strand:- start:223 stop:864 length:642 start_codon:yes stop_codon:yes gene_type:complete